MRRKLVAAVVAAMSLSMLVTPAAAEPPVDVDDEHGYLCVRWEAIRFSQCVNWTE